MIALFILTIFQLTLAIDFDKNGYNNVVVSIHPDVPETSGQDIINNIKVGRDRNFYALN